MSKETLRNVYVKPGKKYIFQLYWLNEVRCTLIVEWMARIDIGKLDTGRPNTYFGERVPATIITLCDG